MSVITDKILVLDLEATCWENGIAPNDELQKTESEIIEIGIGQITRNFSLINRLVRSCFYEYEDFKSYYVKPTKHEISEFCTKLTGITPELIKKEGTTLEVALNKLNKKFSPKHKTLVCWGNYDKNQILKECNEKQIENSYQFSDTYLNLKNYFALHHGLKKEIGLKNAVEHIGMKFVGNKHSGKDDAFNIASILVDLIY